MELMLSVIADPGTSTLAPRDVDRLCRALDGAGAALGTALWLCPETACEVAMTGLDLAQARACLSDAGAGGAFDLALQPAAGRRKGLLVADMESTIIGQEMVDEMAARRGIGAEVAAITRRAMAGELPFETALRQRVALLAGYAEPDLADLAAIMTLNRGASTLVATMRRHGATCALVSGGFSVFAEIIARRCGFDALRANRLEIAEGQLTGRMVEPIQGPDAKARALCEFASDLGIAPEAALAVGDGSNDVDMVRAAGLGVAYRGKPILKAAADVTLDHARLDALLYVQGYHRDEFIDPEPAQAQA